MTLRFQSATQALNFFGSLVYARDNKSIILYVSMVYSKAPLYMLSCNKAPKRSKLGVTNIGEKPMKLFYGTTRASILAPELVLLI